VRASQRVRLARPLAGVSKGGVMGRLGLRPGLALLVTLASGAALAAVPDAPRPQDGRQERQPEGDSQKDGRKFEPFKVESVASNGTVTIGGHPIAYQAIAGTLIVHPKGWDDVPRDSNAEKPGSAGGDDGAEGRNPKIGRASCRERGGIAVVG